MRPLKALVYTGVTLAASTSLAYATPLPLVFGQTVVTDTNASTNQAAQVQLGAVTVSPDGTVFSTSGVITAPTFTGTAAQTVFHDLNNPFNASTPGCGTLGCLTFEEQFSNTSGQGVEHLTIGNLGAFAGF